MNSFLQLGYRVTQLLNSESQTDTRQVKYWHAAKSIQTGSRPYIFCLTATQIQITVGFSVSIFLIQTVLIDLSPQMEQLRDPMTSTAVAPMIEHRHSLDRTYEVEGKYNENFKVFMTRGLSASLYAVFRTLKLKVRCPLTYINSHLFPMEQNATCYDPYRTVSTFV